MFYCYFVRFQYEFGIWFCVSWSMQKKIIQFLPYSYHIHTGGLEKIAQTLSDGFNSDKNTICLNIASDVCRWYTGEVKDTHDTIYIPSFDIVYNYPIPKIRHKKFWQTLVQIKKYNPDIIQTHTRFFLQSMIGWLVAKWLWYRRVHVEHGSGFVNGYPWYIRYCAWLFDRTVGWRIFRQCDSIVTISQAHKEFISKFTSKEPVVIYNPIEYTPQQKVTNKVIHIGFVASLLARKWCDILIKALKKLQDKQRTCTIVGDGDQRKRLEQLTADLWLQARISFVWADDRANWLHTFDIFVNPSHQEWLPTTVVEALIASCIVVATDVWGTREISDQEDLIMIESGKVDEIKKWLKLAFARLDTSGASYEWVVKKFWLETAIKKYTHVCMQSIKNEK